MDFVKKFIALLSTLFALRGCSLRLWLMGIICNFWEPIRQTYGSIMHTRAMQVKTRQCLNPRRRPSATIRIESACGVATDWVTCGFLNPKRENVNGTWRLMYSREVSINRFTKREWVTYFAEGEVKVQPLIAWLHGDPTALDVEVRHTVGKGLSCQHAPQRVTKCMVLDFCTNAQQKTIPKNKKLSVNDNIACCRDLLLNQTIVDNHIFRATKIKMNKYSCYHEAAIANGTSTNSKIVPFAADTLGNFCSVSIILIKALAKIKFSKTPGSK